MLQYYKPNSDMSPLKSLPISKGPPIPPHARPYGGAQGHQNQSSFLPQINPKQAAL